MMAAIVDYGEGMYLTVQFDRRKVRFYEKQPISHHLAERMSCPFIFRGTEYTYHRTEGAFRAITDELYPEATLVEEDYLRKICLAALL